MRPSRHSPATVVAVGLAGLAAAMGIGRFALTPILPLLADEGTLGLTGGSALAAANYAGYLVGAVACAIAPVDAGRLARGGLGAVAAFTLAMGVTDSFVAWLAWRFAAGVASALALVGISSWGLHNLAARGRAHWAGGVFAGVGTGIAFAGLVVLALASAGGSAATSWIALGLAAAAVAVASWPSFANRDMATQMPNAKPEPFRREAWLLVACYGTFGFGYIVPATYLPSVARDTIADAAASALLWPVFGLAAALSTLVAGLALRNVAPRRVWLGSQLVMAAGVAAPALRPGGAALLFAAVAIGGTFMVLTMAGMQEARRMSGGAATRLIAGMTAAFAVGQLAGPVVVAVLAANPDALAIASLAAAGVLLLGAIPLFRTRATTSRTS
jgi:MFS family permease